MKRITILVFTIAIALLSCSNDNTKQIYNLAPGVTAEWNPVTEQLSLSPLSEGIQIIREIRREIDTLDGKANEVLSIARTGKYSIQLLENGNPIGNKISFVRQKHAGLNAVCTYNSPNSPYNGLGRLNDGIAGSEDYSHGEWVGWKNKNAVIEFEFEDIQMINFISLRYRDDIVNNIFPPKSLELEVSYDGINWQHLITRDARTPGLPINVEQFVVKEEYKNIRITVNNYHTGDNMDSWLLIDEVSISEY